MGDADDELISRAVQGNVDVLSQLLESWAPQMATSLGVRVGVRWRGVLDVEDVLQVTFLEAFLRISQCKASDSRSFHAWLMRIAENNLCDAIRALDRGRRHFPPAPKAPDEDSNTELFNLLTAPSSTPSRRAGRHEIRVVLNAALERLPPDYEKVVRLYDLEGRSAGEVGRALGRSEGAVYMLRARAHDRLRQLLGTESRFFSDCP